MGNRSSFIPYQICRQLAHVPGLVETYVSLTDLAGIPPLYDSGWRRLQQWLKEAEQATDVPSDLSGQHLLFFSVLPNHIDYALALAVLLLSRGASIDFAWLPHATYGSQTPPTLGFPYWMRHARRFKKVQPHPRLRLVDLSELQPAEVTPEMRAIASQQALTDTCYVMLKESVKIDTDAEARAEFNFCLNRNLNALSRVAVLCQQNRYDRTVLMNGAILEFGALFHMVSKLGIPTSTYEIQNNGTIIVSHGATVMGMDSSDLWAKDEPHIVTEERRARVQELIDKRQRPAEKGVNLEVFQLAGVVPGDEIRRELGLVGHKPLVLICPNCPFDAAYFVEGKRHFATMVDWLLKTVDHFRDKDTCNVVVRCHPAERYYQTVENTVNIISDAFSELPPHIKVVKPEDPISTYSIMQVADLGIIYWSTTGLEMTLRGIPVVSGVPCLHYNSKGFTLDPDTVKEYFELIDQVIAAPFRLTERQVELAWSFADIYFNDWPQPFPWGLGRRFWQDLKEWPISRMLSAEGEAKFGNTIRNLMGTN